jgi:cell wall-associated NlpC family hydrolase
MNRTIFLVVLFAAFFTGCTSSGRIAAGWGREYDEDGIADAETELRAARESPSTDGIDRAADRAVDVPATTTTSSTIRNLLESELDTWMGVPYVLGGTSRRGVDCSGLVQQVFSDVFNIQTPRTTSGLKRTGSAVSGRSLRTGDLVFFEPGGNSHVGIYLGNEQFAHASSSSGVMVSSLSEPYWRRSYTSSRRILGSGDLVVGGMITETKRNLDLHGPHW